MSGLDISVVGDLRVQRGAAELAQASLGGRHARLVFVALVLERDRPLSTDALAEILWGDDLPSTWGSMVRTALTRVRRAISLLGPDPGIALVGERGRHRLVLAAGTVVDLETARYDVTEAEEHLASGGHDQGRECAARAERVVGQPILAGIESAWLDGVRDRTVELRVRALEAGAACALELGDLAGCLDATTVLVDLAPLREEGHRLAMRAHSVAGRRAVALRTYERCRHLLATELGIDPSERTQELYVALLGDEPTPAPTPRTSLRQARPSTLIGRDAEIATLTGLLDEARVVTITGVGGVGKTSVARVLACAAEARAAVHWVDLTPIGADAMDDALAQSLGGAQAGRPVTTDAMGTLGDATALVVLDNCEHVLDAAAGAAQALIERCPNVRILATSRAPLGLLAEHVHALRPLPTPAADAALVEVAASPAVELFLARARATGATLTLGEDNAAAIATICRRVDGVPLALELAAPRTTSMAPEQIAHHLDERFSLLRSRHRDTPDRHRGLDEVVRWSYELLTPEEQATFRAVAVCPGTLSLRAAAAIVGSAARLSELELLDILTALVEKSMLVAVPSGDEHRFQLLETLRAYGLLRLEAADEADDARDRFVAHFLAVAETAAVGLQGPDEGRWVAELQREMANVFAAFGHAALAVDVDAALRCTVALFHYAFFRMRADIGDLATEAVSLPGAEHHELFGAAQAVAGYLAWERGDADKAQQHIDVAAASEETWITADAQGTTLLFQGAIEPAIAAYERALALASEARSPYLLAISLSQQSFAHLLAGRTEALSLAIEAEAAAAESGNPTARAQAAWAIGLALFDDDPELALDHLARCVELASEVGNKLSVGAAADPAEDLRARVEQRSVEDDLIAAIAKLEYWVEHDNPPNVWVTLRRVVRDLTSLGYYEQAAVLAGAEQAAPHKIPPRERELVRHRAALDLVRHEVGTSAFALLTGRGSALSQPEMLGELQAVRRHVSITN